MPIRPENRGRYPADWPAISRRVREEARQKCEQCGAPNGAVIVRLAGCGVWAPTDDVPADLAPALDLRGEAPAPNGRALPWEVAADVLGRWRDARGQPVHFLDRPEARTRLTRVVLTVAHLNHTPEDCRPHNLAALCQRCHLTYDAKTRGAYRAPLTTQEA